MILALPIKGQPVCEDTRRLLPQLLLHLLHTSPLMHLLPMQLLTTTLRPLLQLLHGLCLLQPLPLKCFYGSR